MIKDIHKSVQQDFLLKKGKSLPVGTVSGNYKKVAEGKWDKVKKDVGKNTLSDNEHSLLKDKIAALDRTVDHYSGLVRKGLLLRNVKRAMTNKGVPEKLAEKVTRLVELNAKKKWGGNYKT